MVYYLSINNLKMNKYFLSFSLVVISVLQLSAQVIWSADPNQSTNVNDFFRRFDSGNYPTDYCVTSGDEAGVTPSSVVTANDPTYGKVWKVNKPQNRKRGELARSEGDNQFYAPTEGDDIYIGWRWKIDTENGGDITDECTVWQWKSEGAHDQNYPLNMEYDGDLTLNAWGPDYANNTSQSSMRTVLWRKAVPQDTWVTLVVRIKVDKDDFGGVVQFWFNGVQQELMNSAFDKYQVNLSADKFTANHRTNDGSAVYPKWGIYNKKSCAYNVNAYFNEMKIGNTLNDVMPSGSNTTNQAPTVEITSPSNGATFNLGETISLGATASDSDGSIEKVNFKIDGGYHTNDRTAPYTGSFTPTEAGTYVIGARAFDDDDAQTEVSVTITVVAPNQAPTVEITSPLNGAVFFVGDDIILRANAEDDNHVTKVNFKVNGGYHSQDLTPNGIEYTTTFIPTEAGTYTIGARAFDADDESTEVSITIDVNLITSIVDATTDDFGIYPNPSTGLIHLNKSTSWEVFNLQGVKIKSGNGSEVDMTDTKKGSYIIKAGEQLSSVLIH